MSQILGDRRSILFSAALCRGLIEARSSVANPSPRTRPTFSAALCRGLIEAQPFWGRSGGCRSGFPRLYAAASLKLLALGDGVGRRLGFPRLYAAASLKRGCAGSHLQRVLEGFPRLYAAASLKPVTHGKCFSSTSCFPRLYAAASLKPVFPLFAFIPSDRFSAALCRGLIEACSRSSSHGCGGGVFRGFMPRPH